ncbi:MAG: hypothetical protein IPP77_15785 [Bacteroidetes bacterium]|nr:hypothetical protein [Bacteroidota bacterium]
MPFNPNIHHRRSIRLKGYDYSQAGLYFITICCADRACLFGKIENGEMVLNEFGNIASNEWMKTPQLRPQIEMDVFIIMPNHMHAIIAINDTGRDALHTPNENANDVGRNVLHTPNDDNTPDDNANDVGRGVLHTPNDENKPDDNANEKQGVCNMSNDNTNEIQGVCNTPLRSPSNTVGAIIRGYKSSVTKQINALGGHGNGALDSPMPLWQRNYHEHIIRNEKSYQTIAQYIINNPAKWADDKFYKQ